MAYSDSSYINLRIVNSQTPMTRTTEVASAKENAIYDGILCIFEGSNESTAQLKTAVVIDQLIKNPVNSASIDITQRLATGTHAYGSNLYVLALLNTTSTGFKVGGSNNNELLFDGASKNGATISDIQTLVIHSVGSTEEHVGLFMSNAPQSDGTNGIWIMPRISGSCLFDTPSAAASGDKLTIHVERAAAKVKVTNEATTASAIRLDGDESRHPTVHRMTWTLHNYNTQSYAIRNGFTVTSIESPGTPIAFDTTAPDLFDLYKQHSNMDGASVYIAENTTNGKETQVIVEVQLKEGSFLLGDCYRYQLWGADIFFTSADNFIQYCKTEWKKTFASINEGLTTRSSEEVFRYPSLVINDNGTVTLSLSNESFTSDEQTALSNLATTLSNTLTGYREGKMYYTYKIKHNDTEYGVVRNNAYNLKFTNVPGIGDPVPRPNN